MMLERLNLRGLWAPLLFQVDFTDSRWARSTTNARAWLVVSAVIDLVARATVGGLDILALGSLAMLAVLWTMPPRLTGMIGSLGVAQVVVGYLIFLGTGFIPHGSKSGDLLAMAASVGWPLYCLVALIVLVRNYLQTPKALMQG